MASKHVLVLALAAATLLSAGCGGGSGAGEPTPVSPTGIAPETAAAPALAPVTPVAPAPAPVTPPEPALAPVAPAAPAPELQSNVTITVLDGPIRNAKVCLDKNRNDACDAGEPVGRTDAAGKVTLTVDTTDVGQFPAVAEVGTDAVDADNGPVAIAFVLKAPADRTAIVSPLTTLVQNRIENTGVGSAAAEAALRSQIGAGASLFDDFGGGGTEDAAAMARLARLLVVTTQQQTRLLVGMVGQQAADGKEIQWPELTGLMGHRLLQFLPAIVAKTGDDRLLSAKEGDKARVISVLVNELLASLDVAMSTATVKTLVAMARSPDSGTTSAAPAPMAALSYFHYIGSHNWTLRVFTATASQNTPDSTGRVRSVERRLRSVDAAGQGAVAAWGYGEDTNRHIDVHWNGAAWVGCPLNFENRMAARDERGRGEYDYCDGHSVTQGS